MSTAPSWVAATSSPRWRRPASSQSSSARAVAAQAPDIAAGAAHRLYVIHGSHPCVAVERALELKGQPWSVSEVVPPTQVVVMKLRFGRPTVPAIRFADG